MSDVFDNLSNLNEEELKAVAKLIDKFANRKDKPRDRHRNRKPKKEREDTEIVEDVQVGREKPRKRIVQRENERINRPRSGRGRTEPTKEYNKKRGEKQRGNNRRGNKTMARTESVQLEGHNKFLDMPDRHGNKKDTEIDKLLWSGRQASDRSESKYEPVEVRCKECSLWFDIHPSIVLIDEETKDYNYTCDNCASSRRP